MRWPRWNNKATRASPPPDISSPENTRWSRRISARLEHFFETALRFDSQNPTILNYYVALLLRTGNAVEALPYAERAVRVAPDSPDTLAILGYAQYANDRNKDAIRSWKRSLALRPDAQVQKYPGKSGTGRERGIGLHAKREQPLHPEIRRPADAGIVAPRS